MCQEQPSRQTQRQMQRHKDKHKDTNTKAKIHFKKDYVGAPTPGEAGGCKIALEHQMTANCHPDFFETKVDF